VVPAGIRPFLQPALDVDGRRVRGSKNELNRHDIVVLRLRPRPSVRVGDKCVLVKGQHLTGLDIDREQAPSEIGATPAPDHDTRRAARTVMPVGQAPGVLDLPDRPALENLEKIDRGARPLGLTYLERSDGQGRTVRQIIPAPVKHG
jgi:hypothetical protein